MSRATNLNFRNPKEYTPEFYNYNVGIFFVNLAKVTNDGTAISYNQFGFYAGKTSFMRGPDSCNFAKADRFPEYKVRNKNFFIFFNRY